MLATSAESTLALAVDLGGTKIEAAIVDETGAIVPGSRFRSPTGREATSEQLVDSTTSVVRRSLATLPTGGAIAGVGIGTAGPITLDAGLVSPLNLPAWRDFPLRELVADHLDGFNLDAFKLGGLNPGGLPVTLRMDGECIALAEHWVGAAQGVRNVMGMVISTGVGGGLILGGVAFAGPTGNAGHIGHVEVGGFDDPCGCGGRGCLEAVASGPKTTAWAQAQGWSGATGEDLAVSYAAGDAIAVAAVQRCGRAVGQAIASATALLDLELVAIGGGFSRVSADLLPIIRETITERAPFPFVAKVRVVASGLSGDGPLIGAGALIHRAELIS